MEVNTKVKKVNDRIEFISLAVGELLKQVQQLSIDVLAIENGEWATRDERVEFIKNAAIESMKRRIMAEMDKEDK